MATKKVSYKNLLKEAISEFTDVAKSAEVKGPFLDGIMKWDGGGELPTHKDAASILERYYFEEDQDGDVEVTTEEDLADDGKSGGPSMKNAKGAGTEQAGTSDASSVPASKDEKAKDIAKEQEDLKPEDEEEVEEQEKPKDEEEEEVEEQEKVEDEPEEEEVTEDIENAVIEKLIAEMEEEDEEEEVEEAETMAGKKDFEGPAAGMEAPKEKVSKNPEEDTTGAGTEQAGTGTDAGQVPDRKDVADSFVKPKKYTEQEEAKPEEEEEEELDVDKKIKEDAGVGPGPIKAKGAMGKPGMGEDEEDIEEAFQIFKEQIEDEEDAPEEEEVKEQEEEKVEDEPEEGKEEVKV
jgi:hypothetical protein